jgi:hypothetical protein
MTFHADATLIAGEPHDPQQTTMLADGYLPASISAVTPDSGPPLLDGAVEVGGESAF